MIVTIILGKKPQNAEQVREVAEGATRIRGEKLGIVGKRNGGEFHKRFTYYL